MSSVEAAHQAIGDFHGNVVIKPQSNSSFMTVEVAKTEEDADFIVQRLFSSLDVTIRNILIERSHDVQRRLYITFRADRSSGKLLISASDQQTEREYYKLINPFLGLRAYQARDLAADLNLEREHWREFTRILQAAYQCYIDCDAELLEINPLGLTYNGDFIALNAHLDIDNNAIIRHPELLMLQSADSISNAILRAKQANIHYVRLEGQIGCIANGTGLALATLDAIHQQGATGNITPANFLDIGGIARPDKIDTALKIVLAEPTVQAVIINIFGGITRCDEIARGIVDTYEGIPPKQLIVIRLAGNQSEQALEIIQAADIPRVKTTNNFTEAVEMALQAVRGGSTNGYTR